MLPDIIMFSTWNRKSTLQRYFVRHVSTGDVSNPSAKRNPSTAHSRIWPFLWPLLCRCVKLKAVDFLDEELKQRAVFIQASLRQEEKRRKKENIEEPQDEVHYVLLYTTIMHFCDA